MNNSTTDIHAPSHSHFESSNAEGPIRFDGVMLTVICLVGAGVITLFCYYISWALKQRELNLGGGGGTTSASEVVHLPMFIPQTFPITTSTLPSLGSSHRHNHQTQKSTVRASTPPPSYDSIFPDGAPPQSHSQRIAHNV